MDISGDDNSVEDLAWADSCLILDPEQDSSDSFRNAFALLEIHSSQLKSSVDEKGEFREAADKKVSLFRGRKGKSLPMMDKTTTYNPLGNEQGGNRTDYDLIRLMNELEGNRLDYDLISLMNEQEEGNRIDYDLISLMNEQEGNRIDYDRISLINEQKGNMIDYSPISFIHEREGNMNDNYLSIERQGNMIDYDQIFLSNEQEGNMTDSNQINECGTDTFSSRFDPENIFLPTYNENQRIFVTDDPEMDSIFPAYLEDQPADNIFNVWELHTPDEGDELIEQMKNAIAERPLVPVASNDQSLDDLISGFANIALSRKSS